MDSIDEVASEVSPKMDSNMTNISSEIVFLSTIIGIIIASQLTLDDQNIVGNFLQGIGQNILIINAIASSSSFQTSSNDISSSLDSSNTEISDLQNQINELRCMIKKNNKKG